jgi:ADP-heptose:LPS heptosyltransferase
MFASMVGDLRRVAASVTLVCDSRLVSLFAASLPGVTVADPLHAQVSAGAIDKVVAMGSLGHAFRPTLDSFPRTPYLAPRAEARADWAARLGPRTQPLRIGLTWRGGTPATRSNFRSLSLARLQPLLQIPGCEYISLQHGDVEAEIAASPAPVRNFPADDLRDFESLAALTAELDLVISVQTSLVHLCGAIGQTCLTFIPHNPEWRYGAAGSTMPWYDSVRLYRQAETGDWDPVIEQIELAVRERLAAAS